MHAREAVQHLSQAVLQASSGRLRDDATALCLDWHGGPPRHRDATSGANREERAHPGAGAERVRRSRRLRRRRLAPIRDGPFWRGGGALAAGEPAAALGVGRRVVELVVVVEG
jgi:hypothetical protein